MRICLFIYVFLFSTSLFSQLDDACKLSIGTNLGGLADYGTELPFVDLMHNARTWYTKDEDNPNATWNSEKAAELSYRSDGYPTHVPQEISSTNYPQKVATIWAITDGWPTGQYTVLWDGNGELSFWGGFENLEQTNDSRIVFDFNDVEGSVIEMTIEYSDINDPIRNIRVLMPGSEQTYVDQPFNPIWLEKLSMFESVRFMDWGVTNNWGQDENDPFIEASLFSWDQRAQMDHYTWANKKGIPYEMMIKLMNDYDLDAWVCVPHRADDNFISKMATLFHEQVEDDRHLYVEYSNEIWNWLFSQTHWLNQYGCEEKGISWPEGIVPYIQNCLDRWTEVYMDDLHRLTRVVGVQVSWQDVSNRIVNNMEPGSFDAFSPTYYFGLTEEGDEVLDALGPTASARDVAYYARKGMESAKEWLRMQKSEISDPLGIPMVFYEGGQHLTGHPFGVEPSYAEALLAIQRDTSMYNMYNEWFDFLKTLQTGNEPLLLMNFSFISNRSAQYGSWGILETMDQDFQEIYAPKFQAIKEQIEACNPTTIIEELPHNQEFLLSPNPSSGLVKVKAQFSISRIDLFDTNGKNLQIVDFNGEFQAQIDISMLPSGIYFVRVHNTDDGDHYMEKVIKF